MKQRAWKRLLSAATVCTMLTSASIVGASALEQKPELLEVRTIAGQQKLGFTDGTLDKAMLYHPTSLVQRADGTILISDTGNHKIRLYNKQSVTTYSGHIVDFDADILPIGAYGDGTIAQALYQSPAGLTIDSTGNVYVADKDNNSIRIIATDGNVRTLAGSWEPGFKDGKGNKAAFYQPSDVAVDSKGNVYVADTLNHTIRKIDTEGNVTTLNKPSERAVQYAPGSVEYSGDYADGPLAQAMFNEPSGLAIDYQDNLYVSDKGNQRIRYINFTTNQVSTISGGGNYASNQLYVEGEYVDGDVAVARFHSPTGITVTSNGVILVADTLNHAIRAIHNGVVTTIAGNGDFGITDGVAKSSVLHQPTDVIELADGTIAIADSANNKIKQLQSYTIPSDANEIDKLKVIVNGKLVASDVDPFVESGRTYVPLRAAATALDINIQYSESNKQVELNVSEELKYLFSTNSKIVTKIEAGLTSEIEIDSAVLIKEQRVFVPIRFISEQLGYDVQWDASNKNVVIRSSYF